MSTRLTADEITRLDRHSERFNMSRSECLRHCFLIGLDEAEAASKIVSSPIIGPLLQLISDIGSDQLGEEMRSVRQQIKDHANRDKSQQSFPFSNDSENDGGLNPNLA